MVKIKKVKIRNFKEIFVKNVTSDDIKSDWKFIDWKFFIIKDNRWYILKCLRIKAMHDFTLLSYKMIRVDSNQFDIHFCLFATCLCLKTNSLNTSFKNGAMECPPSSGKFVSYKHTEGW